MGQLSRLILDGTDAAGADDLDAFMAEQLLKKTMCGLISADAAREYAMAQHYVENGYMRNYSDMTSLNNLVLKKEDIDYTVSVVSKDSLLFNNGAFDMDTISPNNRLAVPEVIDPVSVRGKANKTSGLTNSFDDATDYSTELFNNLLSVVSYKFGDTPVESIELQGGAIRVNKSMVDLTGIVRKGSEKKLTLCDLVDLSAILSAFPGLKALTVDESILTSLLLKSQTNNPLNDIFSNSGVQTVLIRLHNKNILRFNRGDTSEATKKAWLDLRQKILDRQRLSLAVDLTKQPKWAPEHYLGVIRLETLADTESGKYKDYHTAIFKEQGSIKDRLISKVFKVVKTQGKAVENLRKNYESKKAKPSNKGADKPKIVLRKRAEVKSNDAGTDNSQQ